MSEESLREMIFNIQPYKAVIYLHSCNESHASEISSACDTTYSHAVKIMNRFLDHGLVTAEKEGRKKLYQLTEKGEEFAEELHDVEATFDSSLDVTDTPAGKLEEVGPFG